MVVGVSSPRFVGRAAELAAMEAAFAHAADARPGAVLIEGAAGSGKSRLAAEFSQIATRRGAVVVFGACIDLGQTSLPYAAVIDALRGLAHTAGPRALMDAAGPYAADLGALLPELEGPPARDHGAGGHARLLHAVLRVFTGMAVTAPLVVVIEDIHWADAATRDLIAYFVRTIRRARVLAILTVRSDDADRDQAVRELLGELRRDPVVRRVTLSGLQRDEVAQQAAAILGSEPPRELVDLLVERSDGNPFFVEELLATSQEGENLPPTLRDVLLLHVDRLGDSTRRVVDVAAVIGRRFDESVLAALVDMDARQLDTALRDALEQHVLVVDEAVDGYRFRHALLQEAVYAQLLVDSAGRCTGESRACCPIASPGGRNRPSSWPRRHTICIAAVTLRQRCTPRSRQAPPRRRCSPSPTLHVSTNARSTSSSRWTPTRGTACRSSPSCSGRPRRAGSASATPAEQPTCCNRLCRHCRPTATAAPVPRSCRDWRDSPGRQGQPRVMGSHSTNRPFDSWTTTTGL